MAQPIVPAYIDKEYLINNFSAMKGYRERPSPFTHFVPKPKDQLCIRKDDVKRVDYPIYECNCRDEMSRSYRESIVEEPLLKKVEQTFDKKKPLVVYGVGSGGCYPELFFCVGLAEKRYEVRHIVLVDNDYDLQNDPRVTHFTAYAKVLFPNAQIDAFKEETEYFEEIKTQKQPKPDIILCIDVEPASKYSSRVSDYKQMLESSSNQSIFVYHNPVDPHDRSKDVKTSIETIHG